MENSCSFHWGYLLAPKIDMRTQSASICSSSLWKQFCNFFNLVRFSWNLNKDFSVGIERLFSSEVTNTWFFCVLAVLEGSWCIKLVNSNLLWVTWDIKKGWCKSLELLSNSSSSIHSTQDIYSSYFNHFIRNLFFKLKLKFELLPCIEKGNQLRHCSLKKNLIALNCASFPSHFLSGINLLM